MKLKLILIIAGLALAGGTVTIVVIQSKDRAKQREVERQKTESADQLQGAMSNYGRTFELNTNLPLWPEGTNKPGSRSTK